MPSAHASPDARARFLRRELKRLGLPKRALDVAALRPMLPEHAEEPFSDPGWLFELKHDGFRLLAAREGGGARLRYRSGAGTSAFPDVERAVAEVLTILESPGTGHL